MERIAIERVLAAKCSLENRPYGGQASATSKTTSKTMWGFGSSKDTEGILVGRAPITTKQFGSV
jgi:hypothetical protein